MADEEYDVELYVYDLLSMDPSGMARNLARQFIPGFQGIWHTGIVVYGKEYYFGGGGVNADPPGTTPYGTPIQKLPLGKTAINQQTFHDFLSEMAHKYTLNSYNIITNNCNNFTDDASQFLTGNPIPAYIVNLPQNLLNSPIGRTLMPLIRQFTGGEQMQPNEMPNLGNMANMFGGMPNLGNFANMFGGNAMNPSSHTTFSPSANASSVPTVEVKKCHKTLKLSTLEVNSKQTTLFSTSSSVEKIFQKLISFVNEVEPSLLNEESQNCLNQLQYCLDRRDKNPNYSIPSGTFVLIEKLLQTLPADKQFPILDILRLVVLHPTASAYFSKQDNPLVDNLIDKILTSETQLPDVNYSLTGRVVCNIFSTPIGGKNLLLRTDKLVDFLNFGLASSLSQFLHSVATLSYNCSIYVKESELSEDYLLQFLSSLVHALNNPISEETAFTLLMALGRMIYQSSFGVEIVKTLELNLEKYLQSSVSKIKGAAEDIHQLLQVDVE